MATIIDNINSILNTKGELKTILNENGQEPGDVFSEYPDMFRSAIQAASENGANEEIVNAYISAYLSAYNFIDQDALSANSYLTSVPSEFITQDELSAMGYLTSVPEVDLSGYVTTDALNGMGYLTAVPNDYPTYAAISGMGYLTSVPSEYITDSELSACGYLTSIPSEYITDAELSACGYLTQHQDLSSYVSYSYLADQLSAYATQSYVMDKIAAIPSVDLSGYVTTDALNGMSYVSQSALSGMSYITQNDLSGMSYITLNDVPASPVIDENIIPKENNTYTLGDSSYIYSATYTDAVYVNTNNKIYNTSNGGMKVQRGGTDICAFLGGLNLGISPVSNNTGSLGNVDQKWNNVYARNHYYGSNAKIFSESSATSEDLAIAFSGVSYYYINKTRFAPNGSANNGTIDLGTADRKWKSTYTSSLYADNLANDINSHSIVPAENNTYTLGSESYLYSATYTSRVKVGNNSQIYNDGGGITLSVNSNAGIRMGSSNFYPKTNNAINLGQSSNKWNNAYISNLYADTIHNFIWTGTAAQYAALNDYTTYQLYLVQES